MSHRYRAQEEDVTFEEGALDALTQIGSQTSLRYALNLIAPSSLVAKRRKATEIGVQDLRLAYKYFTDVGRSLAFIEEQQGLLMFGESATQTSSNGSGQPMGTGFNVNASEAAPMEIS